MKVLVIGGAGFIGANLIRELQICNVDAVVLDNFSTGSKKNLPADVESVLMDYRDEKIHDFIADGNFNAVIHLAGQTTVAESIKNPKLDAQINITGTINLLESIRHSKSVERIIFASTAAVYGDSKEFPIKETQKIDPKSFYALSKATVEEYLRLYHEIFGVNYVSLRFSNAYGEFQSQNGVISIFARKILNGERLTIYGSGNQTRDFIHARDVARGIYHALITKNLNEIYNISTQTEISLNELALTMNRVAEKEIFIEHAPARVGDVGKSILSNARAKDKLAWTPKIDLTEGLQRTFEYFGGSRHENEFFSR